MTRGRSRIILVSATTLLALSALGCPERSGRTVAGGAGEGGPGRILYLTYCQSCHGVAGRGDGPAAAALREPPADLTRLFERYGTPLDRERLAEYVDGRRLSAAHRAREMPIWGSEFFDDVLPNNPDPERVKRRLIEVLVDYLETLQTERAL